MAAIPGLRSNVTFRMTYGGTSLEKTQDIVSDSYVVFQPQPQGISGVTLAGPATGAVGVSHTFTATVSPMAATLPITYTWQASGQAPLTHAAVSSPTDTVDLTWAITGTQTVTVTAANVAGGATGAHTLTLYAPPQAGFAATPISGTAPLTVTFTNTTTGDYMSQSWDFGDGSPLSTATSPTHVYETRGTYTVTLTVSGPGGTDSSTEPSYITVYTPVQAALSAEPTSGVAPLSVAFSDASTGDYTSLSWDFGDGTTSTEASPMHVYATPGVYTVALTASGPGGTDTETGYIDVAACQADFTATPTNGVAALTVDFTNTSSGSYTSSQWDFGDGGTSTKLDPTHRYKAPGVYTVSLTVSGPDGTSTATKPGYITVCASAYADFEATPLSGVAPLTVTFTDKSCGAFSAWSWDFGDGSPAGSGASPTHTYSAGGVYTVTLTASGASGTATKTKTDFIAVDNPLQANSSVRPSSGAGFLAALASGWRHLLQTAGAGLNASIRLSLPDLTLGKAYSSGVQAIDTALAGGTSGGDG